MTTRFDPAQLIADLATAPVGMWQVDEHGAILWCNETVRDYLGVGVETLVGHRAQGVLTQYLEPGARGGLYCTTGRARWFVVQTVGRMCYFNDVTALRRLEADLEQANAALQQRETVDALTGLLNHRGLAQALEQQVSRSRRYGNALSLMALEILGAVNNVAGVAAATDQVQRAVGQLLRDQLRWVDFIGRSQENLFTIILPETPEASALKLADKLRDRLADLALPETDARIKVDAGLSVTAWNKGDDMGKLLRRLRAGLGRPKAEEIV